MRRLYAILLALTLTVGCSTTDVLKAATGALGGATSEPLVGIETDIGDKQINTGTSTSNSLDNVEGNVQLNNNNQKQTKNVNSAEQVTFNERMSPFALILIAFLTMFGAIGWMLPSWAEMRANVKGKK